MSMTHPDVFLTETLSQSVASGGPAIPSGAMLGKSWRGPQTATLISNWTQFERVFGGFYPSSSFGSSYLPFAVRAHFDNGGGDLYIARVLHSDAVLATNTLDDQGDPSDTTLKVDAVDKGVWGNDIYVQTVARGTDRFDLVVYYGGNTASFQVERWNDLSMDDTDARYVENVVNSTTKGSTYIRVTDLDSSNDAPEDIPAIGTEQLASGSDGSSVVAADYTGALSVFDSIDTPLILNIPGEYSATVVNAALAYAAGRRDVFVIVDPQVGQDAGDMDTYIGTLTETSYGAVYYPWIVTSDPSATRSGVRKTLPPGGFVLGQFMKTDRERGPQKAPAGINNRVIGALDLEVSLTEDDLATLHTAQVNAIRPYPGAGICIMGARTIKRTGDDRYIPVRRTLIYVAENLVNLTRFAVFEPNHEELWELLALRCSKFLSDFHAGGGLRGGTADEAFFVKCDAENNTPQTVEQGEVNIQVGVALLNPAEFVIINLAQFDGGATVTEEA